MLVKIKYNEHRGSENMKCHELNKLKRSGIPTDGILQKLSIKFHLMICANCQRYEEGLQLMQSYIENIFKKRATDTKALEKQIIDEITRKTN